MNVKICDRCGKAVWQSDKYCECGKAYEDIIPRQEKVDGAFERHLQHKFISDREIDEWFKEWENKYVIR